jgi:hypothetical protein
MAKRTFLGRLSKAIWSARRASSTPIMRSTSTTPTAPVDNYVWNAHSRRLAPELCCDPPHPHPLIDMAHWRRKTQIVEPSNTSSTYVRNQRNAMRQTYLAIVAHRILPLGLAILGYLILLLDIKGPRTFLHFQLRSSNDAHPYFCIDRIDNM